METTCPDDCRECKESRQSINGIYCPVVRRYVEYDILPPCKKATMTNDEELFIQPFLQKVSAKEKQAMMQGFLLGIKYANQ